MRKLAKIWLVSALGLLSLQCGKENGTGNDNMQGSRVRLLPISLPAPPAGTVYEGWLVRLVPGAGPYDWVPVFASFGRFSWNNYAYTFLDPAGNIRSADFETGQNLFTERFTAVPADTVRNVLRQIAQGDTLPLIVPNLSLSRLRALFVTIEPSGETGPDLARPGTPLLISITNDSGVINLTYPINYRTPDVGASYFIATPSDTLVNINKDTTTEAQNNEARGLWLGRFSNEIALSDTGLVGLQLLKGWQLETWLEKGSALVSLGKFFRGDSADRSNPYARDTARIFRLPGEDFVVNPPAGISSVLGGKVLVTLEPFPDVDPALYPMILFQDTTRSGFKTGGNTNLHTTFTLDNRARFLPQIKAVVLKDPQ